MRVTAAVKSKRKVGKVASQSEGPHANSLNQTDTRDHLFHFSLPAIHSFSFFGLLYSTIMRRAFCNCKIILFVSDLRVDLHSTVYRQSSVPLKGSCPGIDGLTLDTLTVKVSQQVDQNNSGGHSAVVQLLLAPYRGGLRP